MSQEVTASILKGTSNSSSTQSGDPNHALPLLNAVLVILLIYALWRLLQLAFTVTIRTVYLDSFWLMNLPISSRFEEQAEESSGKQPDQDGN